MSNYWKDREVAAQNRLANRSIRRIENQIHKYYLKAMQKAMEDFEATYNQYLKAVAEGREPSPATLYSLDRYWQMQAQTRAILEGLGNKQAVEMAKTFEAHYYDIYNSISLPAGKTYSTISPEGVQQMINQIWAADGKSWSQRVWGNTSKLMDELNETLIHCVTTGKKTTELKKALQERFNVSYSRADCLVRTEIAHIQTEAAKQRYEDYGIQEFQVWGDEDERRCDTCASLHQKKFPIGATPPVPVHPRCRCCIIPVVEIE